MEKIVYRNSVADDREIIDRIINGEPAWFEVLIRRNNPVLYKIARNYGYNHQDAEDLMQETYVSAYQHLGQFAGRASFKTWISKIMIYRCLYKFQHGSDRKEQPASDFIQENAKPMLSAGKNLTPEHAVLGKEFSTMLEHALQTLPVGHRTVFLLRQVEGFSVAETAEMMSISEVNVKVRFGRAKAMLQKELEQFYTNTNLYEFNLIYCDKMVAAVFRAIARA
jgi:RNA polymerase sigma factor (sigma-70 family)